MAAEPTDEQLEHAWRALAHADWARLPELRTAHRRYLVVRALAISLASGKQSPAEPPAPVPAAAPPQSWGSLRVPKQQPMFDRKSAAAGEREDDSPFHDASP